MTTALPVATTVVVPGPAGSTQGQVQTWITAMHDWAAGLFGTDGTIATALSTLAAASIASLQTQAATAFTTAGTAPSYTLTPSPALAGYAAGQRFRVKLHAAPAGSDTLNVSGLGAKTLKQYDSTGTKIAAVLASGMLCDVEYDGTDMVVLDPLPAATNTNIQGSFKNLKIVASGLSNTSAMVTADQVVTYDGSTFKLASAVNVTVNSTASGVNGLDTGTVAASTWYSVWIIQKADGTTAGLLSLSATAPTMPSGYTFKARVGWVRTDGTGSKYLLQTLQLGSHAQYVVLASSNVPNMPSLASGTQGTYPATYASIAVGNFVPATASEIDLSLMTTSGVVAGVGSNNAFGSPGASTNPPQMAINAAAGMRSLMVLESTSIYAVSSGAMYLFCAGWTDNL